MKKTVGKVLLALLLVLLAVVAGFGIFYSSRIKTIRSIQRLSDYEDGYNLYRMDVSYNYDLENLIRYGVSDNQAMLDSILKEAMPLLPIHMTAPNFGCSAFSVSDTDGCTLMGRNYDFKQDTSAMLVYCAPKNGYKSVAFTALNNLAANQPDKSTKKAIATLAAPFVCLDGMNEKGVSIAVLTLDSEPTKQETGKDKIFTTLAIRLVLDRAATTQEAVDLLRSYDMFATSGRDYHFYITDASGDGRVVEYDCDDPTRPLVDTPIRAITNFYGLYIDRVQPNQRNGIYGHGKERYDSIEQVLDNNAGSITNDIAWQALQASAQLPNPEDVTSNTQWSLIYNDTEKTAQFVLRRNWNDVFLYDLNTNDVT